MAIEPAEYNTTNPNKKICRYITFWTNHILRKIRGLFLSFSSKGTGLVVHGFPIYIMNPNVHIGDNVQLYPNISFLGEGEIIIADNVKIGNNVIIHSTKGSQVIIGSHTLIAANSYIIDCNHNTKSDKLIQEQGVSFEPIEIGKDVWIGASCVIGKGSRIGDGSIIGANSFVNSYITPYSIAFGTPAKIVKDR